ncbi:hypothetical protein CDAR_105561 [Caerostris darwini]|uniref:Uncharacterized protein n=1 Tax=Caerostris darwini TaxID=1538125 RepID=A0AAV4MZ63_9ARAC|nr:hypothetical protein CDAR_105561 [Caerostris darwini]
MAPRFDGVRGIGQNTSLLCSEFPPPSPLFSTSFSRDQVMMKRNIVRNIEPFKNRVWQIFPVGKKPLSSKIVSFSDGIVLEKRFLQDIKGRFDSCLRDLLE